MTGAVTDPEPGPDRRATLVSLFRGQAGWCTRLGSPMYGHMLEWAADDLARGGPTVAEQTGRGRRVLEIGASAGLNLRWDRFRYEAADWAFGDSASPARIPCEYDGGRPPLPPQVWVMERAGCDPAPIDATTDEGSLTLQSFVWPEQLERLALLRAA